jgi:hypothetical protein
MALMLRGEQAAGHWYQVLMITDSQPGTAP